VGRGRVINHRAGHDHELLQPETAIDPSEDAVSIDATKRDAGVVRAPVKPIQSISSCEPRLAMSADTANGRRTTEPLLNEAENYS